MGSNFVFCSRNEHCFPFSDLLMKKALQLLAYCLCFYSLATAQKYDENIEVITTRNGLPHNIVLSVLQDSEGFLWIGTYNGLCRYDGHEFKVYRDQLDPTDEGWTYTVETIFEDRDHHIWIGTRGGMIARLNKKNDTWERYPTKIKASITQFHQQSDSVVYVTAREGYFGRIVLSNGAFSYGKLLPEDIMGIMEWKPGKLLLFSTHVYEYDPLAKTAPVLYYALPDKQASKATNNPPGNILCFKLGDSLVAFDNRDFTVKKIPVPRELQTTIQLHHTGKDKLLLANSAYLATYSFEDKKFAVTEISDNVFYERNSVANCIARDHSGILWIGTNIGLQKIDLRKYRFAKYSLYNRRNKIPHNYIRSLYFTGDTLWMGFKKGNSSALFFNKEKKLTGYRNFPSTDHGKPTQYLSTTNAFYRDHKGRLWSGTLEGLFLWNEKKQCFEREFTDLSFIKSPIEIWCLLGDNKGYLWIGTNHRGIFRYHAETRTLKRYYLGGVTDQVPASVWTMYPGKHGEIYLGTNTGLLRLRTGGGTPVIDRPYLPEKKALNGEHVWNIQEDISGRIWLGTTDKSIDILDPEAGTFTHLNSSSGLPGSTVCGLLDDRYGNIWISQTVGLSLYDIRRKQVISFSEDDGLISNDFNFKTVAKSPWGTLFGGTKTGMISFDPADFGNEEIPISPVRITSVKVNGEEYFPASGAVQLAHKDNSLHVRFALLNFRNPRLHRYRFMLRGIEKEWNYIGYSSPVAMYTQLPSGNYSLVVEASTDGVHWQHRPAILNIYVQPAWWERDWFWILFSVAVLLVIALFIMHRVKLVLRREKETSQIQKKIAELELTALQAQMNPHFIFNAINSIQHFILRHDALSANDYLSRFARLMRLILESSRKKYIALKDEVELIELYLSLEVLRFEDKFVYSVTIAENLPMKAEIPCMLMQPFIENAINHGLMYREDNKGMLLVSITCDDNKGLLICTIADNGIGRKRSMEIKQTMNRQHNSFGMDLVNDRIKTYFHADDLLVNIDITDRLNDQQEPEGTLISITIPIENL